jgi:hypothetical protein
MKKIKTYSNTASNIKEQNLMSSRTTQAQLADARLRNTALEVYEMQLLSSIKHTYSSLEKTPNVLQKIHYHSVQKVSATF